MKNINNILIAAVAGIALSLLTSSTQAQVKGGERMLQKNGAITEAVTPSDYRPMSCVKCQDVFTTVPDTSAKGASRLVAHGVPTKTVISHSCEGCNTTIAIVGGGKHATTAVTHKCASCGSVSLACCSTTKSTDAATKGMDK